MPRLLSSLGALALKEGSGSMFQGFLRRLLLLEVAGLFFCLKIWGLGVLVYVVRFWGVGGKG